MDGPALSCKMPIGKLIGLSCRRISRGGLSLSIGLFLSGISLAEPALRVDLYIGASSPPQAELVAALEQALADSPSLDVKIRQRSIDDVDNQAASPSADLCVAIGTSASNALARSGESGPRLYGFIPRPVWQQIKACCVKPDSKVSALFLDRAPIEYLQLGQAVSPSDNRFGVLLGPVSKSTETELRRAAAQVGVQLSVAWVKKADDVGPALRKLLDDVAVLIALPDPVVFNSQTIYPLLLASYSAGLPVVAYSNAMVRAGSAAAVLVSPQDAGRDLAAEILHFGATRQLRPARSSPSLSVRFNQDVLRSLGIEAVADDSLVKRLRGGQL